MKTPFGIHAEYVSERAVNNCVNMFKKEGRRVKEGTIYGDRIDKDIKNSLDLCLYVHEIDRLKVWYKEMHNIVDNYIREFPILAKFNPWGYVDGINIQYYKPGGGYPKEHAETMAPNESHRLFVFMTYLTDTKDGGTEFTYLNWTAPCKKGLTLIWPANYLYAHKGVISNTEEKMIITGWLGFKKDEKNE